MGQECLKKGGERVDLLRDAMVGISEEVCKDKAWWDYQEPLSI